MPLDMDELQKKLLAVANNTDSNGRSKLAKFHYPSSSESGSRDDGLIIPRHTQDYGAGVRGPPNRPGGWIDGLQPHQAESSASRAEVGTTVSRLRPNPYRTREVGLASAATNFTSGRALVPVQNHPVPTARIAPREEYLAGAMRAETVKIAVGKEGEKISVDRKCLFDSCEAISKKFGSGPLAGVIIVPDVSPDVFRLFIECIYTKNVPGIDFKASPVAHVMRVKTLCMLYAFVEKYQVIPLITNKIMDAIQDGFVFLRMIPNHDFIAEIYANTPPNSKLRNWCAACLLFELRSRSPDDGPDNQLSALLCSNSWIINDFLTAVSSYTAASGFNPDPRFRDCGDVEGCQSCIEHHGAQRVPGYWPCAFHVHPAQDLPGQNLPTKNCPLWSDSPASTQSKFLLHGAPSDFY